MNLKTLCILALACSSATLSAQKKPLDQSAYDGWKSIASPRISDNVIGSAIRSRRSEEMLCWNFTTLKRETLRG